MKIIECDDCGKEKIEKEDGSNYEEFADDYETKVRDFWLCNRCKKKYPFAW